MTRADFEQFRASVEAPLSVGIGAGTLYNTPPPTQGLASLIILALFDRLRVREAESFEHVHGIVEATKRAFRLRDRVITDPDRITVDLGKFLSPAFLDEEAGTIDMRKAAPWPAPDGEGDTIWMGAADSSGLVVSYIQSLYWEFGSGCVLPSTGVLMQNRGASFSLDPNDTGAQRAGARPPPVPHAQSGARRAEGWPRHGLRHAWAATASRRRKRPCSRACHLPPAARARARGAALAAWAAPGARPSPICAWSAASTAI